MTNPTLTFMCPEPNRVKGEGGGIVIQVFLREG
jgi:hypothetical protein